MQTVDSRDTRQCATTPDTGLNAGARSTTRAIAKGRWLILTIGLLFVVCGAFAIAQADGTLGNPIFPGDHPDPTIVRIGRTYWTASTSGNWAPEFPLYRSVDLHHWTAAGSIFSQTPAWADGSFWAPELVVDRGRLLVYYVGRKRGGPLCVAVAIAGQPAGPYTDHGPIMCQQDGSIDPAFARDERDRPFLVWKEDGNSQSKPTTIWAQPLTSDLLHLTGEKSALLVNEPASWEGGVIEAPYILRHQRDFYLFYAGNACCGLQCHYAEGVARAHRLLGPWTRDPANPIIRPNQAWRCPGHGTAVETPAGKDLFIYHAYPAVGDVSLGRESVLDTIEWTAAGWPVVNGGRGPGASQVAAQTPVQVFDGFAGPALDPEWKWPVGHETVFHVSGDRLTMDAQAHGGQTLIARSMLSLAYTAQVAVLPVGAAGGGLAIVADARNDVGLSRRGGVLELWRVERGERHILWTQPTAPDQLLWLRVASAGPGEAAFSSSTDGKTWSDAGPPLSGTEVPPWDQGLRIGLVVDGPAGATASFAQFSIQAAGH
jgi:xylan 1,4-beta-xylosidase